MKKILGVLLCFGVGIDAGAAESQQAGSAPVLSNQKVLLHISGAQISRMPLAWEVVGDAVACQSATSHLKYLVGVLGYFDTATTQTYPKISIKANGKYWSVQLKQTESEVLVDIPSELCSPSRAVRVANMLYERVAGVSDFFYSRVAFVGESTVGKERRRKLYVMNLDGSDLQQLIPKENYIMFPKFSPSGRYLSFVAMKDYTGYGTRPELWVIDFHQPDTPIRLYAKFDVGIGSAVFCPQDERLLVVSMYMNHFRGLYQIHMNKPGAATPLQYPMGFDVEPSMDPTQQRIVFSSLRTGLPHIFAMPFDALARSAKIEQLTFVGQYNSYPTMDKTGQWIAFAGARGGNPAHPQFDLFKIDVTGQLLHPLTQTTLNEESPQFSYHSSHHLLFVQRPTQGGVSVLHVMHMDFPGTSAELRVPLRNVVIKTPTWSGVLPKTHFEPKEVIHVQKRSRPKI